MALSDAMLASAIKDFLSDNSVAFEKFLYERYNLDTSVNFNGEVENRKRVIVVIETLTQDEKPMSERHYALHIETLHTQGEHSA